MTALEAQVRALDEWVRHNQQDAVATGYWLAAQIAM